MQKILNIFLLVGLIVCKALEGHASICKPSNISVCCINWDRHQSEDFKSIGICHSIGAIASKSFSKTADDNLEDSAEAGARQIDDATKTTIRESRAVSGISKPKGEVLINTESGFVKVSEVYANI